jgi:serine/threonine protein kinase
VSTIPAEQRLPGRYEFVRPLGHGSFGHTLLARERAGGRLVAIKVLDARTIADWKEADRFEREAAVLRSLRHQGIPEVYDLIRDEQSSATAYLVMEFVDGESLRQMIDEKRLFDPAALLALFLELLSILEYLHARVPPVLHRDVKPANIIVRPNGLPVLVDFGSVRREVLAPDEFGSTIAGTYGYMPFEQYMGQASPASDLYALGATFLHLLTGRPPRDFMTPSGSVEVPEMSAGDPRLRSVIARLIRASPAERFRSAREVRDALLATSALPVVAGASRIAPQSIPEELHAPVPRAITGATAQLLDRVAPSTLELMDGSAKRTDKASLFEWASLVFFSVLTAGILPMVFISMARARRRRLRRFFQEGIPALAEIISIQVEKISFEATIARVSYQFELEGVLHRDTDQVLPVIAGRWQPGDRIQILCIPELDYDSVIISTR